MNDTNPSFNRLMGIMDELREKCPWDKKQTIQTLRTLTIEEMYELADAITEEDWAGIKEELGDLLLHIVFYAKIGKEQNRFTMDEVINQICDKLISRHPHIYGDIKVNDEEDVKRNWENLKLKEGKTSVLGGVPVSLPATVKAIRLQEKAAQVKFEWENKEQVWDKVEEEIRELKEAEQLNDADKIEEEFGDLVFSLINYARFLRVDAENALERTNRKFKTRFMQMEKEAITQGKRLSDLSLSEMDAMWDSIKKKK
ncbi:MAG: nucleoside triphosphate pyrophosphohydrolase [Bacteroidetes bacterium]|nr:nucleoside triphosphate pyrophosphohydrolase [Bacteroidota bacterium]